MLPLSHTTVSVRLGGLPGDPLHPIALDPSLYKPKPYSSLSLFWNPKRKGLLKISTTMASNIRTNNFLRHVESMRLMPSGAGHIPHLNAIILGDSLATEEDDFVLPSDDFASQAIVQSPEQVLTYQHMKRNNVFFFFFWELSLCTTFCKKKCFFFLMCVFMICDHQYLKMYKRSIEDPAGFWSEIAEEFYWKQKWGDKVCDENFDIRKGNIKIEVTDLFPLSILDLVFAFAFVFVFPSDSVCSETESVFSCCIASVVQGWDHQHLL